MLPVYPDEVSQAQPPPLDLYGSYQNWINSLNPATAGSVRTDPGVYATPDQFDSAPFAYSMPDAAESAYARDTMADRARGILQFAQLVDGGASREEAYLRVAHLLNPAERLGAELARFQKPADDTFTTPRKYQEGDKTFWQTSPNQWRIEEPPRVPPPRMPQDVADERKLIEGKLRAAQNDPYNIKSKPGEIEALENRYRELGTNWPTAPPAQPKAMPGAPTQPIGAPPPAEVVEVVRVTKDGRKAVYDANTRRFIRYQ